MGEWMTWFGLAVFALAMASLEIEPVDPSVVPSSTATAHVAR